MWLRTALKQDIEAVEKLLSESHHAALDDVIGEVATCKLIAHNCSTDIIKKAFNHPASEYIVADDGDQLHGVAYASHGNIRGDSDVVTINFLAVRPESQRQGIGRQLLIEIEESFPLARKIRLYVADKNNVAKEFLQHQGYKPLPRLSTIAGVDVVAMEKLTF